MKQRLTSFAAIALILATSLGLPLTVNAIDRATIRRYAENNILFYNPEDGNVISTVKVCKTVNSAGAPVGTDAELEALAANKKFSVDAANKYGFRWEILATLHSMEHGLARDNPENLQGAYQLYSYTNGGTNENRFEPAGPISDEEFARQSDIAASVVKGKIDAIGADVNTDDGVKKLFFAYNGMADIYIEKAKNLGFSDEEARNGEGSSYVMNRFDAARDPAHKDTMSEYWPGRYIADGKYDETAVSNRFGAFVKYKALTNEGYSATGCAGEWADLYLPYTAEVSGRTYCNYKQKDPMWKDVEASGNNAGTMSDRGCFATSTAIALTGFGADVNPSQLGYTGGFDPAPVAGRFNLRVVASGSTLTDSKIAEYLSSDRAVVIDESNGNNNYWTKSQHKIALVDVRKSGGSYEFYVLNPSDRTNGQDKSGWKSASLIIDTMKGYWVIGK